MTQGEGLGAVEGAAVEWDVSGGAQWLKTARRKRDRTLSFSSLRRRHPFSVSLCFAADSVLPFVVSGVSLDEMRSEQDAHSVSLAGVLELHCVYRRLLVFISSARRQASRRAFLSIIETRIRIPAGALVFLVGLILSDFSKLRHSLVYLQCNLKAKPAGYLGSLLWDTFAVAGAVRGRC